MLRPPAVFYKYHPNPIGLDGEMFIHMAIPQLSISIPFILVIAAVIVAPVSI